MVMVDLPILSQKASVTLLLYSIAWHVEKWQTIKTAKRRVYSQCKRLYFPLIYIDILFLHTRETLDTGACAAKTTPKRMSDVMTI